LRVPAQRLLAVGDSLRTDIAGAGGAGIDSLWVLGGIHGAALGGDMGAASRAAEILGLAPKWAISRLIW